MTAYLSEINVAAWSFFDRKDHIEQAFLKSQGKIRPQVFLAISLVWLSTVLVVRIKIYYIYIYMIFRVVR